MVAVETFRLLTAQLAVSSELLVSPYPRHKPRLQLLSQHRLRRIGTQAIPRKVCTKTCQLLLNESLRSQMTSHMILDSSMITCSNKKVKKLKKTIRRRSQAVCRFLPLRSVSECQRCQGGAGVARTRVGTAAGHRERWAEQLSMMPLLG